jgi:nucleotide-binding universal stress UspA family protein
MIRPCPDVPPHLLAKEKAMAQDVLVVIDTEASIVRRMKVVAALGKQADIRVTGAFVTGLPASAAFADVSGWAVMVDAYMTSQRDEAARAEATFRRELSRLNLAGDWLSREADLTEGITALARLHDLVVLGQPEPAGLATGLRPEELVLAAGRPVLVIPYVGDFTEVGRNILVAWSGTRESARALHDAMFLIERAAAVTVLEVDRPGSEGGAADLAASDVVAALQRRGIAAKAEITVSDGTPVADIILSLAADLTADLVVMGAWGHSRLREFVLGGVSRGILKEMTVPVLMSH